MRAANVAGMEPARLFDDKSKYVSCSRLPSDGGIVPVRLAKLRTILTTLPTPPKDEQVTPAHALVVLQGPLVYTPAEFVAPHQLVNFRVLCVAALCWLQRSHKAWPSPMTVVYVGACVGCALGRAEGVAVVGFGVGRTVGLAVGLVGLDVALVGRGEGADGAAVGGTVGAVTDRGAANQAGSAAAEELDPSHDTRFTKPVGRVGSR